MTKVYYCCHQWEVQYQLSKPYVFDHIKKFVEGTCARDKFPERLSEVMKSEQKSSYTSFLMSLEETREPTLEQTQASKPKVNTFDEYVEPSQLDTNVIVFNISPSNEVRIYDSAIYLELEFEKPPTELIQVDFFWQLISAYRVLVNGICIIVENVAGNLKLRGRRPLTAGFAIHPGQTELKQKVEIMLPDIGEFFFETLFIPATKDVITIDINLANHFSVPFKINTAMLRLSMNEEPQSPDGPVLVYEDKMIYKTYTNESGEASISVSGKEISIIDVFSRAEVTKIECEPKATIVKDNYKAQHIIFFPDNVDHAVIKVFITDGGILRTINDLEIYFYVYQDRKLKLSE